MNNDCSIAGRHLATRYAVNELFLTKKLQKLKFLVKLFSKKLTCFILEESAGGAAKTVRRTVLARGTPARGSPMARRAA